MDKLYFWIFESKLSDYAAAVAISLTILMLVGQAVRAIWL
jgi:hypothetical protein